MTAQREAGPRWAGVCRWSALSVMLSIALARAVIVFAPQTLFDVDPARFPGALGGLGPAGSLWLDVALVIAAAAGLFGEAQGGRPLEWRLLLLAALPWPLVLWHGREDLDDLWYGSTWAAAMLAAVALAHLAREAAMRRTAMAVLAAAVGPLLVRGAMQITVEHADTLAAFEASRERFLADRGWAPDSAAAAIYERRLRQPQPTGWFVTSNVYASVLIYAIIVWSGLGLGATRARLTSGWIALAALVAAAPLAALWYTGSKGAALALVGGLVLLSLIFMPVAKRKLAARLAPWVILVLVGGAVLGVAVRGAVLPESFAGERSLLFRWHYLLGAARIVAQSPWAGVGPGDFQEHYTQVRPPRSPEEVASAHNLFADWLTALGAAALAWVVLVALLAWRAGRHLGEGEEAESHGARGPPMLAILLATVALAAAGAAEWHTLDPLGGLARSLGVVLFAVLAVVAGHIVRHAPAGPVGWSFAAAAAAVLVHGQIEMTFSQSSAAVWALCCMGLAGSTRSADAEPGRGTGVIAGTIVLALAGAVAAWLALAGAWPATLAECRTGSAARELRPLADVRTAVEMAAHSDDPARRRALVADAVQGLRDLGADESRLAAEGLDQVSFASGPIPADLPERIERVLAGFEPARRQAAATLLLAAHEAMPITARPLEAAAEQLRLAAAVSDPSRRRSHLLRAREVVLDAVERHGDPSAVSRAIGIDLALARESGEARFMNEAQALARRLTVIDPHAINTWKRLGDLYWEAGDRREAKRAYRRALENDANFGLDPLKQLPGEERERLVVRLREGEDHHRDTEGTEKEREEE